MSPPKRSLKANGPQSREEASRWERGGHRLSTAVHDRLRVWQFAPAANVNAMAHPAPRDDSNDVGVGDPRIRQGADAAPFDELSVATVASVRLQC